MKRRLGCRALLLLPLFLAACDSQETKALQERWEYFDRQIATWEERVEKADAKLKAELEDLEEATVRAEPSLESMKSRDDMLAQIRELIGGLATLENSMFEKARLVESYKVAFQPKTIPPQTNLGDLTLTEGTSYKSVVVRETTGTHLSVVHASGFSNIPFGVLPDSLRVQIAVPPAESQPYPNPTEVVARKPANIKSASEHAADRERAIQEQQKIRDEAKAKSDAEFAEKKRKTEEQRKIWDQYQLEASSIDRDIRSVELQISNLVREKDAMEYANRTGTVKLARADLLKKLRPLDDQIEAYNLQLEELKKKRSALKPPSP
ncbi:MAG: hypothetical protein JNJ70_03280 [Verrucomicrobiales bacterium]|nr:hypothetical protein [Verrucomicrobiales bacterium]